MRICNFNASPNPAKLPKRKPAASTLRANPEHRGSSLVHPPLPSSPSRPGFPRSFPPSPLRPFYSCASAFTAVASIAESHNASSNLLCATTQSTYSNASRFPPARSNRFRPCAVLRTFVFRFFRDCQARCLATLSLPCSRGGLTVPVE